MFKSLLILGLVLFLNIFNITQSSERQFFKEYLLNTTQVDIYNKFGFEGLKKFLVENVEYKIIEGEKNV